MITIAALYLLCPGPNPDQVDPAGIYIYRAPLDDLQAFEWIGFTVWPDREFDLPPDGDEYCYKCELMWPNPAGQWTKQRTPVDKECQDRAGCHQ